MEQLQRYLAFLATVFGIELVLLGKIIDKLNVDLPFLLISFIIVMILTYFSPDIFRRIEKQKRNNKKRKYHL